LYSKGEFELALVFFHRCKRIRSDTIEYQTGINKSEEAIVNCVGDPDKIVLNLNGDLSIFETQNKINEKILTPRPDSDSSESNNKKVTKLSERQKIELNKEKRTQNSEKPKTVRQLLGELYADKVFLEKLLEDDEKKKEEETVPRKRKFNLKKLTFF
jgi:tetratricopeptide repeat protein 25